jgi:hypothetical protein
VNAPATGFALSHHLAMRCCWLVREMAHTKMPYVRWAASFNIFTVIVDEQLPAFSKWGYLLTLVGSRFRTVPDVLGLVTQTLADESAETHVIEASGPYRCFAITRTHDGFPLDVFVRGQAQGYFQCLAYTFKEWENEPIDLIRTECPLTAITSAHIVGDLMTKRPIVVIHKVMHALRQKLQYCEGIRGSAILAGLGAADVIVMASGDDLSVLHETTFSALRSLSTNDIGLTQDGKTQLVFADTNTVTCHGESPEPRSRKRSTPTREGRHALIMDTGTFFPVSGPTTMNVNVNEFRHSIEPPIKKHIKDEKWSAIICSFQPGKFDTAVAILLGSVRHAAIDIADVKLWSTRGDPDLKLGISYREFQGVQRALDSYHYVLEENRARGGPMTNIRLEHECEVDLTQYSIHATEAAPTTVDFKTTDRLIRSLENKVGEVAPLVNQAFFNVYRRYLEVRDHAVARDTIIAHRRFIKALLELVRMKGGAYEALAPHEQTVFISNIIYHLNECMPAVETLDDLGQGNLDRYLLSFHGLHKLVDACYGLVYDVWGYAAKLFSRYFKKDNGELFALCILASDDTARSKIYCDGIFVVRFGVSTAFNFVYSINIIRHVARAVLKKLLASDAERDSALGVLGDAIFTNTVNSLSADVAHTLETNLQKAQKVHEICHDAVSGCIGRSEGSSMVKTLWGPRCDTTFAIIFQFMYSRSTVARLARFTAEKTRANVYEQMRPGVERRVRSLQKLQRVGPEIFYDVFLIKALKLEFEQVIFLRLFSHKLSPHAHTEIVFGAALISSIMYLEGKSEYKSCEELRTTLKGAPVVDALAKVLNFDIDSEWQWCFEWHKVIMKFHDLMKGVPDEHHWRSRGLEALGNITRSPAIEVYKRLYDQATKGKILLHEEFLELASSKRHQQKLELMLYYYQLAREMALPDPDPVTICDDTLDPYPRWDLDPWVGKREAK